MNTLLSAKHWHIFTIVFGVQLVYRIILVISTTKNPEMISFYLSFQPLIVTLSGLVFFMWMWKVAVSLYLQLRDKELIDVKSFKIAYVYTTVYILVAGCYILFFDGGVLIAFHLAAIFALVYCLFFVIRLLKAVELGHFPKISDYFRDFLLLLFFPIGIWIIQPRINSIFPSSGGSPEVTI
ncbi:MAG: hypothetical protein KF803_09150 [Cyclobacteriaceae bacterium]|nr:hypothetical protein [Cyclobacteriaceae bacterium]